MEMDATGPMVVNVRTRIRVKELIRVKSPRSRYQMPRIDDMRRSNT